MGYELEGTVLTVNPEGDGYSTDIRASNYNVARLVDLCHGLSVIRGWWHNIETGEPLIRNVPEMLCLIHSEISEAMEGYRKSKMDEHCPEFKSIEIELADALIRICDLAGGLNLRLGDALTAKLLYNTQREDHSIAARLAESGKKF